MSDADKRRDRVEEIGEENADDCGQERQLQCAEDVELQEYCVEVGRTQESWRSFDLSRCPRDQGYDKHARQVSQGTTANNEYDSNNQADDCQHGLNAERSEFYVSDRIRRDENGIFQTDKSK